MRYRLECGEIVPGCEGEVSADSPDEVLRQAAGHAREAHGIEEVSEELRDRLAAAIREG